MSEIRRVLQSMPPCLARAHGRSPGAVLYKRNKLGWKLRLSRNLAQVSQLSRLAPRPAVCAWRNELSNSKFSNVLFLRFEKHDVYAGYIYTVRLGVGHIPYR